MKSVAQLSKPGRTDARANGSARGLVTALIYTRVSSEDQAREGVSLDAQLAECRRYAARPGWVLGDEYQDILSGKRDDRPQYQALLADVRRLRANGMQLAVVVAALDRFGRKLLERVRCREELKALGVPTHSVREGGEVSDIVANVLAAVAQEEVRRLGERVRASLQHCEGRGWHKVGWCPWGYQFRDATPEERAEGAPLKVLDTDPLTAPYVQEAFRRADGGETLHALTRWLAALPEAARGGRAMCYQSVRRALSSPVYIARFGPHPDRNGLSRPAGRWPALIDDATWQRVQEGVAKHHHMPRQASGRYLLTGLLRCPQCGARMRGRKRSGSSRATYWCCGFLLGGGAPDTSCRQVFSVGILDAEVLDRVTELVDAVATTDPFLQAELRRAWKALQEPSVQDAHARAVRELVQAAERARQRLTRAAELFVDGKLEKPDYDALRDKTRGELEACERELDRLHGTRVQRVELPPLETVLSLAGGWAELLCGAEIPRQRDVLGTLIVEVTPVRLSRGKYDARIAWTPLGEALRALVAKGSAAAEVVASVPVNHLSLASAADLDGLPGVGPVLAQRIVERRQRSGPYQAVEQLRDEKILPASTYERVKDLVSIN